MSTEMVEKVRALEELSATLPQIHIGTTHVFHAGMYARTIMLPAGVVLTGALIKIPTVLVLSGDCILYGEEGPQEFEGYHILSGAAFRKQAFLARTDTYITMIFPTQASTVRDAEEEFTDEAHLLFSRNEELECQVELPQLQLLP